jgi:hypothetical protein
VVARSGPAGAALRRRVEAAATGAAGEKTARTRARKWVRAGGTVFVSGK